MPVITQVLIMFAAAGAVFAQASPPAFEVASIKPVPPSSQVRTRMTGDAGRIDYTAVNLRNLIMRAYGVQDFQIAGPESLRNDRFDLVAKIPGGSTQDQLPLMLQTLLAERFKLAFHREQKIMPIYALLAARNGPKLKNAETSQDGTLISISPKGRRLAGTASMSSLAYNLTGMVDRPVLDLTGIAGHYAIDLVWTPDEREANSIVGMKVAVARAGGVPMPDPSPDAATASSLFDALQEVLGLKLEPRKSPVDILVIDHAEKVPTEN